jgi:hypothetical protein
MEVKHGLMWFAIIGLQKTLGVITLSAFGEE